MIFAPRAGGPPNPYWQAADIFPDGQMFIGVQAEVASGNTWLTVEVNALPRAPR